MARKLSKSTSNAPIGFEILPFVRASGEEIWLWACEQNCYDAPHAFPDRKDAERAAQRHASNRGIHPDHGEEFIR